MELGGAEHSDVAAGEALHVALVQLAVLLDGVVQPARHDVELVVIECVQAAASWHLLHAEGDGGVIGAGGAVVVWQHRDGGAASKAQLGRLNARLHAVASLCVYVCSFGGGGEANGARQITSEDWLEEGSRNAWFDE